MIRPPDYGPATKLLGMLHIDKSLYPINDDDRIIVVDDDCPVHKHMTLHYEMCYQLYESDCVFVNERDILIWNTEKPYGMDIQDLSNIYYDNYQNFAYGWLSFSFKSKHVTQGLVEMLYHLSKQDKNIVYHDDLFFTLYYRSKRLNAAGINLMFPMITSDVFEVMCTGLHTESASDEMRRSLERRLCRYFDLPVVTKYDHNYVVNNNNYVNEYIITKKIGKRYLLRNIKGVDYDRSDNMHTLHLDMKHFNANTILDFIRRWTNIQTTIHC